ncbi:uncharacterized protein LOC117109348 [Anneissia japonica]|uniref:uncharacterized protein LOC117109348 n=1 Tax=Anneissia japonica TaxID=1529436 RepID=UPI001425BA8B|nr:uncharacterized protein LOC117109348 [Anneissia japonica]
MTTDASSYSEDNAARMETPIIMPSPAICVSFWYYMYGDSSEKGFGSLNVHKLDVDSNLTTNYSRLVHLLDKPNLSNNWSEVRFDATGSEQEFRIVFEAIQVSSKSDIAIDDVTIVKNSCHGSTARTRLPMETSINTEILSSKPSKALLILDPKVITIVLACGLSFWGVIFSLVIINLWRSHHLRKKVLFDQLEGPDGNELENNNIYKRYESSLDLTPDNLSVKDIDNEYISVKSQMKGLVVELMPKASVKKATFIGDVCMSNMNPGVGKDDRRRSRLVTINDQSALNEIDTSL